MERLEKNPKTSKSNLWRAGVGNESRETLLEQEGLQEELHRVGGGLQGLLGELRAPFLFQQLCSDSRESPRHF